MSGTSTGKGGRPPGLPKTGGRKKGTPNRSTLAVREKLAELNCDPVVELVNIARNPETEVVQRVHIYSSFMKYTFPSPKPISANDQEIPSDAEVTLEDALAWAHYMIEHFAPNPEGQETELIDQAAELTVQDEEDLKDTENDE